MLKPLKLPSRALHAKDSKEFYHGLDALDKQLGRLDHVRPKVNVVRPARIERELPEPVARKELRSLPAPVVKPARSRPDAIERKLREAMREKIEPLPQKVIAPKPAPVVPKGPSVYDRIMKRMQKITAVPEPRAEAPKPVQKPAQPKPVRLPSLQDIKRAALKARVKKSEDREDFRKKLHSFDDELDRLDKKMKKKAK